MEIIISCKDFAVAVKPHGVLSEYDAGRANMITELSSALSVPPESIFPVHRLDVTTEGLMVYALSEYAAAELSRTVANGELHKTYLAFVTAADDLEREGEMRDYLFFDRRAAKSYVVAPGKKGAKEARLSYSLGEPFEWRGVTVTPATVVLHTGRTHQIRAQFSSRHSSIVGDGKYGSRINYKKPALFSVGLSFSFRGKRYDFSIADRVRFDGEFLQI